MSEIVTLHGYGGKEKHFIRLDRLNGDSIIVDVGVCEGDVIKKLREHKQTSKCKIFAIECNKRLVEMLRKQNLFNVEICEKALVGQGIGEKVAFFEGARGSNWGSIAPSQLKERWATAIDSYDVETFEINNIFNELGIDKIDYMKMDIEGSEKLILETMSMEVAEKIKQMTIEVHWPNLQVGITMDWAKERLIELGFEIKVKKHAEIFCERP